MACSKEITGKSFLERAKEKLTDVLSGKIKHIGEVLIELLQKDGVPAFFAKPSYRLNGFIQKRGVWGFPDSEIIYILTILKMKLHLLRKKVELVSLFPGPELGLIETCASLIFEEDITGYDLKSKHPHVKEIDLLKDVPKFVKKTDDSISFLILSWPPTDGYHGFEFSDVLLKYIGSFDLVFIAGDINVCGTSKLEKVFHPWFVVEYSVQKKKETHYSQWHKLLEQTFFNHDVLVLQNPEYKENRLHDFEMVRFKDHAQFPYLRFFSSRLDESDNESEKDKVSVASSHSSGSNSTSSSDTDSSSSESDDE